MLEVWKILQIFLYELYDIDKSKIIINRGQNGNSRIYGVNPREYYSIW